MIGRVALVALCALCAVAAPVHVYLAVVSTQPADALGHAVLAFVAASVPWRWWQWRAM